jgi:hypothetical protein
MFNNVLFLELEPWSSVLHCPDPTDRTAQCTFISLLYLESLFSWSILGDDTVPHLSRDGDCPPVDFPVQFCFDKVPRLIRFSSLCSRVQHCPALSCPVLPYPVLS